MNEPSHFLAFLLAVVVMELTPGPNMGWLALISAGRGRRAGLSATAGIALGLLLIGLAAAAGMAAFIARSDLAWQVLRWAGIAYLFWMSVEAWRDDGESSKAATPAHEDLRFFSRGLIVNLLNPKAALFYVAVLPEFIDPRGDIVGQAVWLTGVAVGVATGVHLVIVAAASHAHTFLSEPRRNRLTRRVLAAGLAAIAIWLVFSTAR